ncbi:MAG: twin-arginine translocase subunit TatC [Christensenellales bacterium]|nr:twin-arginine translocase subunit TatC [Christensenellales bacterium]
MSKQTPAAVSEHDTDVSANRQPLITHLMAFRKLVIAILAAVIVGFVVVFYLFCNPLMKFITSPIEERGVQIIYTAVSEAFTTQLKISLVAGTVLVSPFIFYQIWAFVKPALYEREIRLFRALFFIALLLFLAGITFCYFYVYELALNLFLVAGEDLAMPMLSIDKYVSFLFSFLLPFGVVFELPVAIFMATRMGWLTVQKLTSSRKFVFFGIFILSAVLTPPDVISQIMLGLPMYFLFELGVLVARFTKPRDEELMES